MKLLNVQIAEHFNNKLHVLTHYAYLGLVFVESHGLYGYAAGGMFLVMLTGQGLNGVIKRKQKG